MGPITRLACGAAACATLAGCGSSAPIPPPHVANPGATGDRDGPHGVNHQLRIIDVSIRSTGVAPRVVPLRPGARVRWTNRGDRTHTVTSLPDAAQRFDSGPLRPGESFIITAKRRGFSRYRSTATGDGSGFAGVVKAG